jgi:serine O-acetyltransferase
MKKMLESCNPWKVSYKKHGVEKIYYASHRLWEKGYHNLAYLLKRVNQFIFRAFIPPEAIIGKRLELPHGGFGVVIHKDTLIGTDAIIFHNVTIGNGGAIIGSRVYIGTGTVIIGKVEIGDDVTIGANCLINFDVPDGSTVVGNKATIVHKSVC